MDFIVHANAIVSEISYKDWTIQVARTPQGAPYMQLRFRAKNTSDPNMEAEWSGRKWLLSEHMTDSEIVLTALKAVLTAEEHEARELFKWRGRAILGPHLDIRRLWELAGAENALDARRILDLTPDVTLTYPGNFVEKMHQTSV
jgi:hypothetical protein